MTKLDDREDDRHDRHGSGERRHRRVRLRILRGAKSTLSRPNDGTTDHGEQSHDPVESRGQGTYVDHRRVGQRATLHVENVVVVRVRVAGVAEHAHPMTTGVHAAKVQIGEQQRAQTNHVAADEEPNAHALTTVDYLGRLVMSFVMRSMSIVL